MHMQRMPCLTEIVGLYGLLCLQVEGVVDIWWDFKLPMRSLMWLLAVGKKRIFCAFLLTPQPNNPEENISYPLSKGCTYFKAVLGNLDTRFRWLFNILRFKAKPC